MTTSNKVNLSGTMLASVSYIQNSLVVTSGEKSDGPPSITANGDGTFTIELKADRKKSKEVAEKYSQVTYGPGHMAAKGGGKAPDELNFFFGVTIGVNTQSAGTVPVTVYLAQGHYLTTNNWWIGGNTFLEPPTVLLAISNNLIQAELEVKLETSSFKFTE